MLNIFSSSLRRLPRITSYNVCYTKLLRAGTTVIRFNPKIVKGELYKALPDNYSLQFAGVANLKAKDINTINEIVTYTQTSLRSAQSMELAQKTKEAICKKLNITTDMGSTKFLKTILQDYSYLQMTNGQ